MKHGLDSHCRDQIEISKHLVLSVTGKHSRLRAEKRGFNSHRRDQIEISLDKALSDAEPPRGVQLRKIASGLLPSLTRSLAESRYRSQIRYHQNKTLSRRCGGGYIQA